MSDLVGNPNCWFSYAQAHILYLYRVEEYWEPKIEGLERWVNIT